MEGVVEPNSLLPNLAFALPLEHGGRIHADFRPIWQWILYSTVASAIAAAGWLAYILAGMGRKERLAVRIMYSTYALITFTKWVSSAGYGCSGDWRSAIEMGLDSVPDMLVFAVLSWNQRFAISVSTIYGLLDMAIEVCFNNKKAFFLVNHTY